MRPNPFDDRTKLQFALERREAVSCRIYDPAGSQVAVVADRLMDAGPHVLDWVASGLGQGTYFAELRTSAGIKRARLVKVQ